MIQVVEVKSKREMRKFVDFPLRLYKNCPQQVPALYGDELALFDKKNPYYYDSEARFFLAYKDGKVVGRIAGIISHAYNEKMGTKYIRFSRFDTIDDPEVTKALFAAVEAYGKEKGMTQIHGPLGFNDFDKEGMMIEGFEHETTFANVYNYSYYPVHLEALGFKKEADWLEFKIYMPKDGRHPRIERIGAAVMKRYKLRDVAKDYSLSKIVDKYGKKIFEHLVECYGHLHGYVPISDPVRDATIKMFKTAINPDFMSVIVNEKDEIIGFGLAFPSIADALRLCNGKLFPFGFIPVLYRMKHPKFLELALIAVRNEYRGMGINAAIISRILESARKHKIEYCESNLELESNTKVQGLWDELFHKEQHKRRRCFVKDL